MTVNINASTSNGLQISSDTSGAVAFQKDGTNTLVLPTSGTVTIANGTGTLNAAGPAFSAYLSASQTITLNTTTKVTLDTELFDTNNNFDTTNNRFLPTVAGYYQISWQIRGIATTTYALIFASLYKNGSEYLRGPQLSGSFTAGGALIVMGSAVVYLNGSTDYVELYGIINGSGTATFNVGTPASVVGCSMSGSLIRGA